MKKILVAALCCILSINCYANPPIFKTDYKEAVKVSTALE